ncbi:MAG: AAA family ATPase [Leptospiraceae bacterium]|nr:AAA family ATPase [Leptospiraceae bacterium]
MITLQDYSIKSELYRGDKSIVFRGEKENVPVIIKYLNIEYPNQSEIDYFQKEFNFLKKISLPCVIKPIAIEDYKNSSILVFEDIQGKSLREILKEKENFSLEEFLDLAILITSALGELHGQGVVHKDIKPHNIIYNYKTKKLQIIDFGNATFLSRENPSINPKNLEGTLSYISPEQTGRMNRSIDYRSDYYSLGVTFYQLITGVLPFVSKNSMELVFSHLAKLPTPPHLLSDSTKFIPEIISEIILKLLEKNPENRYQSTNGLLHDLTECKLKFEADGKIDSFILMTKDISKQFRIPEKLYGREKESESLIKIFEQTTFGHLKLALVSGHSGMGKTALIQEVQKPIGKSMGRFISGKFDKFKKNMPYYAIIQAFRNLVEQMLTLDRNEIQDIKDDIQIALGKNGKVLTDIVPELELIVGEQPSIINLSSLEAQNRLNLLFIKFIQVFCKSNNPLVLFLDDLQWADNSSLNLLKTILTDKSLEFLMVILSYRSNEVDNTHPFSILLDEVKKTDVEIENISINPLSEKDVNQLVSETLVSNTNSCEELSNIIHLKTGGNPFFVSSIFTSLYNESLIYFEDKWKWEISKIKQISISENVIDHTKDKISQLDLDKIDILKMAACIGNRFVISVFCKIINKSLTETEEILAQLSNDGYFILGGNEARFAHDKIREATYTFISEEENH